MSNAPFSPLSSLPVIAVDGPAASGKGTLARRLAAHFGFAYLDTGLLYRAVGWAVLSQGGSPEDVSAASEAARLLTPDQLDNPALRGDDAATAASKVGAIPAVRASLLDFQRSFATTPPAVAGGGAGTLVVAKGAVLDGRDIGTVICPTAQAKLFVTASLEKRAERRLKELQARGVEIIQDAVLADMRERDERDSRRSVAPLLSAEDAFVLDTTELTADQAFAAALNFLSSRF